MKQLFIQHTFRKLLFLGFVLFSCVGEFWGQEVRCEEVVDSNQVEDAIDRLADNFVIASLVIAEPSGKLYSVLGHAALRLQCPTFGLDYCFSYESEGVMNKVLTYLAGKLRMGLYPIPTQEYLDGYAEVNRGVREYVLNLPSEVKQELWRVCDQHVEEGADLPFDYVKRGCAISCVHLLNEALHGESLEYSEWPDDFNLSRRELAARRGKPYPWSKFVVNSLIGTEVDGWCSKEEKLIVPIDLAEMWSRASFRGEPLVVEEHELLPFANPAPEKCITPLMVAILLLILAIGDLFIKVPYVDWFYLGIVSIIGIFYTYLIFFSNLPSSNWFWPFVVYNPLPILFWKWRRYWAILYSALLLVWIIGMIAYPHMLVESAHMVFALTFILVLLKNSQIYELFKKNIFANDK